MDSILIANLLFIGFLVSLAGVLWSFHLRRDRAMKRFEDAAYDYTVKRAEKQAGEILRKAGETAREIGAEAEIESIKVVAQERINARKLFQGFKDELAKIASEFAGYLKRGAREKKELEEKSLFALKDAAESSIKEHLSEVEKIIVQEKDKMEKLSGRIEHVLEKLEAESGKVLSEGVESFRKDYSSVLSGLNKTLSESEVDISGKVDEVLKKEIESVRSELDQYKDSVIKTIDEKALRLVERTTEIALTQTLTLSEHIRLVYRALEVAKREGFFEHSNDEKGGGT